MAKCNSLHAELIFSKLAFSKIFIRNTIRVTNSLDSDEAQLFVWTDQDPNYLPKLSADDTSR